MPRPSRSASRCWNLRFLPTWVLAVQICAFAAGAREAPFPIEETLATTTTLAAPPALSASSSAVGSPAIAPVLLPPAVAAASEAAKDTLLQSAAGEEGARGSEDPAAAAAAAAAPSVPWAPVPGLPDLPDANAPLQSVETDAAAAVAALTAAITYGGTKRVPYSSKSGPVWRRGVSPPPAALQANTPAAEQPKVVPIPVPEGIVVEEYEVLSEERVRWVDGRKVTERIWVPFTVGRPAGSTATPKGLAAPRPPSTSSSAYPALFILHSTSGNRARSLQRVIKAAQRGYVAVAPDMRYFGTRAVLWETNCTVWQEKMAYFNDNKTASAAGIMSNNKAPNGNGASCPANPNPTELPAGPFGSDLYEDKIAASFAGRGAEERPFLIDDLWDLQRVLDWLFFVGTDERVEVARQGQQGQQQQPSAIASATASAVADAVVSLSDRVLRRNVFNSRRKLFNVDPARVGTTGISLGGLHSSLLGVVEQRRVAVLAPAIGVPTFAWGAGHGDEWIPRALSIPKVFLYAAKEAGLTAPTNEIYVKVLNLITPNMLGPYDASRSLAAIAPRPLLIANGALDGRNPLGGVGMAVTRAQKVYDAASKSGQLEYFLDPNAVHEYTPLMEAQVNAWLDRWLLR